MNLHKLLEEITGLEDHEFDRIKYFNGGVKAQLLDELLYALNIYEDEEEQ